LGWREGRAHWKNKLDGEVWSAVGERRWGRHPGVVVDGSSAGRLYTAARCSGRGQNGQREAGACCPRRWWEWRCSGGQKVEEEERVLHGGGWVPFIAGRGGGWRAARRQNRGRRNGDEKPWAWQVGGGLEWSACSEHGRSVVRTGRLTGAPAVLIFFLNYPN
jgi:hypothetical protein